MRFGVFSFLILTMAVTATAQNPDTLSYEPTEVTVVGVVVRDTFPGRPNYESIKAGDEAEVYWILHLPKPVLVAVGASDPGDEDEANIDRLQLVFMDPKLYYQYRTLMDHHVKVTGQLFHAISGHHHTRVLLRVRKMVAA